MANPSAHLLSRTHMEHLDIMLKPSPLNTRTGRNGHVLQHENLLRYEVCWSRMPGEDE